jgi:hypothetical protein
VMAVRVLAPAEWQRLVKYRSLPPLPLATWLELHRRYLNWTGADDSVWLLDFIRRIASCAGGRCRQNFSTWMVQHPPRWDDMFAWTVEAHNAVNTRLGKRELTVDAAWEAWVVVQPD